jgi:hypothetical protein
MTSDELYWRLALACRNVEEATLLWWLASFRADERPYREPPTTLERLFGLRRDRVFRVRQALSGEGLISTRILQRSYTDFTLHREALAAKLGKASLGQIAVAWNHSTLLQFDPVQAWPLGLSGPRTCTRLCMHLRSREAAILLAWLYREGASTAAVRKSSRSLEQELQGLVDRRTAMRAMERLQSAGLVDVTVLGRAGTEYRLRGDAIASLLSTFPFHEDAIVTTPGWVDLDFPLLHTLSLPDVEATLAVVEPALEV